MESELVQEVLRRNDVRCDAHNSLWIPQGVAMAQAELGIAECAKELIEFMCATDLNTKWKVSSSCVQLPIA